MEQCFVWSGTDEARRTIKLEKVDILDNTRVKRLPLVCAHAHQELTHQDLQLGSGNDRHRGAVLGLGASKRLSRQDTGEGERREERDGTRLNVGPYGCAAPCLVKRTLMHHCFPSLKD